MNIKTIRISTILLIIFLIISTDKLLATEYKNVEDAISIAEILINKQYKKGTMANKYATEKLQEIAFNKKLSSNEKIEKIVNFIKQRKKIKVPPVGLDALYDMDDDGFPNIFESQQNTDINIATSHPPMYMRLHLLEFKETLLPFKLMLVNTNGGKKDPADWVIQICENIKGKIKTRFKYLNSRMTLDKTPYTITKIEARHEDKRQGGSIVKIDKSKVYLKSKDGKYSITMQVGKPIYSPNPKVVIEDLGTGKMYHVGEDDIISMYLRTKQAVSEKTGKKLKRKITKYNVFKVDRQRNQVIIEEYKKRNPQKYVLTTKAFMPRPIKVVIKPTVIQKAKLKPAITKDKIIPRLGMKLVYVSPGSFMMGSNDNNKEKPIHRVTLSKGYWIGKYEVTQSQYQSIMRTNPSKFRGPNKPVEQVSWNDARWFCRQLTNRERKAGRLTSAYVYRLPTEAEWEFAARGGTKNKGYKYSGSNNIDSVAWYRSNSVNKSHEVGTKSSNELGIYDMSGNVSEWCLDDWHINYNGAPNDGRLEYVENFV